MYVQSKGAAAAQNALDLSGPVLTLKGPLAGLQLEPVGPGQRLEVIVSVSCVSGWRCVGPSKMQPSGIGTNVD